MFGTSRQLGERLARERPVVVMGRGHSGTRIMAWALEALGVRMGTLPEKVTGDAQDRRFTRCIKKIAARHIEREPLASPQPRDLRQLRHATRGFLRWMETHEPAWGWKFPETYLIGNVVDAVFPRARYIHMLRDGRDLAFKAHLTDDQARGLGHAMLRYLDVLRQPRHLQAARSWEYQVLRFGAVEDELAERCHRLSFEELCADPLAQMEAIAEFLEMPMTRECRDYIAANINPAKVSQFRSEDPARVKEVETAIGGTLVACGYPLVSS